MMNKQKGITLIALIITIIVLLILVGVSILLVTGNNGELKQASTAVIKNKEATAKEEVEMAVASARTEYMKDWATNTSKEFKDYLTKEKLSGYVSGTITSSDYNEVDKILTVTYQAADAEGTLYTFIVDENGNVTRKVGIIIGPNLTLKIVDGEVGAEGSGTITATLNGITGNISWSSNATGVATVSGNGNSATVTAAGAGTAEIIATCGEHSAKCNVTVTSVTTAEVTFNANGGTFGSNNETITVRGTAGSSANLPTAPTKENAVFTGWYTAASEGTLVYDGTESSITIPQTSTEVFAHWQMDLTTATLTTGTPVILCG